MVKQDYILPRKAPMLPKGTGWTLLITFVVILTLIYSIVGFLDWAKP